MEFYHRYSNQKDLEDWIKQFFQTLKKEAEDLYQQTNNLKNFEDYVNTYELDILVNWFDELDLKGTSILSFINETENIFMPMEKAKELSPTLLTPVTVPTLFDEEEQGIFITKTTINLPENIEAILKDWELSPQWKPSTLGLPIQQVIEIPINIY